MALEIFLLLNSFSALAGITAEDQAQLSKTEMDLQVELKITVDKKETEKMDLQMKDDSKIGKGIQIINQMSDLDYFLILNLQEGFAEVVMM